MGLNRLDYFWGAYSAVEDATPDEAEGQVHLAEDEIPASLVESFREEEISRLSGEYGRRGVGKPEQVEKLRYVQDDSEHKIVVVNRAIMLFKTDDPIMRRLHRFIETMKSEAASEESTQDSH